MDIRVSTDEGVEGIEGHVIGNWKNGIIAMQWRALSKIASCGYVEAEIVSEGLGYLIEISKPNAYYWTTGRIAVVYNLS